MEVISFIARVVSARNTGSRGPYIVQFVLVIIAPVLMAAVFYVVFVRLTHTLAEKVRLKLICDTRAVSSSECFLSRM